MSTPSFHRAVRVGDRWESHDITVHEDDLTDTDGCGGTLVLVEPDDETGVASMKCAACEEHVATVCASCRDEWVTPREESEGEATSLPDGRVISRGCEESEFSHASVLVRFSPDGFDGEDKVVFGDLVAMGPDGSETPEWFDEMFPNGHDRPWVSSGGYRGHYDTWRLLDGFTKVADGWATGDYDDVPWKRVTHRLAVALHENEPPVEVFVLSEPTSNVFSTAVDIFTRDADHDAAVAWLETLDFTEEGLRRAFG